MLFFFPAWALGCQWLRRGPGGGGRWYWLALGLLAACQSAPTPPATPAARAALPPTAADHVPAPTRPGQARFFALLHAGDSIYALKNGDQSLAQSLVYYTRAQELAAASGDTLLLAEAVFARGRVYDAWNKEPLKTIACFQQATDLLRRVPSQRQRYYYAWHLVAHAYDKVPDTLRTAAVLRAMQRELTGQPPALLRQLPFTVEMALIATQVGQYPLADTLLRTLTHRAWVRNDPETYDYLWHYYLVQSRLDVLYRHRLPSPYLDSLELAYRRTRPAPDRLYYTQDLARLQAAAGQYNRAYTYLGTFVRLGDSLHDKADIGQLRQALLLAEESADRQRRAAEARSQVARTRTLWGLSLGLVIISMLSYYLARQGRRARAQAQRLATMNQALGATNQELATASQAVAVVNRQLDEKVAQVELLNKEIQHRVKNNLHMIFSLLHMQERGTTNEEVIGQLQTARLRVESIAALHNQLLRNPHGLDLGAYLRTLITAVVACLANDRRVVTHLSTDVLDLPANSYFALSLILNEWVTNSIKYAHTGDGPLEITVSVRLRPEEVCIDYADNGRPLPPGQPLPYPAAAASGLGTEIIGLLTEQLGATLTTLPDHPYHYEFCLPRRGEV